jgi:sortase A
VVSRLRVLCGLCLVAGATLLGCGLYLPAKAALAQVLLQGAWERTRDDGARIRPWPWAETWPVARLRVPDLGVDRIVLAGAEGASLAFAPGHVDGTAEPGTRGNVVLGGHRDTTFAFLGDLRRGHLLELEAGDGRVLTYRVEGSEVVRHDATEVLAPTAAPTLTLITCYPLDGTRPRGPWRYVVRAVEHWSRET